MEHQILQSDYAGIKINDNAVATVVPLVNSWKKIDVFDTNEASRVSVPNQADGKITSGANGDYRADVNMSASSAGANKVYEISAFNITNPGKTITGATAADPVVITAVAHGFSDGDKVAIRDVAGMVEINDRIFTVQDKAADTFELTDDGGASPANDIDGSLFTPYTSGGTVHLATETVAHIHRKFGGAGDIGSGAGGGIQACQSGHDTEAYVKGITDASDITLEAIGLILHRVG